jgi:hypothetical protein
VPDLGYVAGCQRIFCQIYGVENRQFFSVIFPVDLTLDRHKSVFFLLVSADPEEDGHDGFLRFVEITEPHLSHITVPLTAGARLSVSR